MKIRIPSTHHLAVYLQKEGKVPDENGYYDIPVCSEKSKLEPYEKELEVIQEVFGKKWRMVTDRSTMGDFHEEYRNKLKLRFPKLDISSGRYLWEVAEEMKKRYGDVLESIWSEKKR